MIVKACRQLNNTILIEVSNKRIKKLHEIICRLNEGFNLEYHGTRYFAWHRYKGDPKKLLLVYRDQDRVYEVWYVPDPHLTGLAGVSDILSLIRWQGYVYFHPISLEGLINKNVDRVRAISEVLADKDCIGEEICNT